MRQFHQLEAVPAAARLQDARPDDAAGPHHADLWREQVHRATTSARQAGLASEQLGHEFSRMSTLRQRVPMSAMRAEDHVMFRQMSTHAARNRFFADVGVTRARARVLAGDSVRVLLPSAG